MIVRKRKLPTKIEAGMWARSKYGGLNRNSLSNDLKRIETWDARGDRLRLPTVDEMLEAQRAKEKRSP